ncbi:MAG: hypothetical protein ACPG4T_21155, partial [Nannocystaceae bacterium]
MAMTRDQRQAVSQLLGALFLGNQELLQVISQHPHANRNFTNGLPPAGGVPVAQYQFELLRRLEAFGIVDNDLFETLAADRPPKQLKQVAQVARQFGIELELTPSPTQAPPFAPSNTVASPPADEKILFLSAGGDSRDAHLAVGREMRAVKDALARAKQSDRFDFKLGPEVTYRRAVHELDDESPDIVHFGGHGKGGSTGGIYFVGNTQPVSADVLGDLFEMLAKRPTLAVFTCCYSSEVASKVAEYTGAAIGF